MQLIDLLLNFLNLLSSSSLVLKFLKLLVILLLLNEQDSHLFHESQVAKVSQSQVHAPHVVLIDVDLFSEGVCHLFLLLRADVLYPRIVDTRKVFKRLHMRVLGNNYGVVLRHHSTCLDLSLSGVLQLFQGQHGAPEDKSNGQVKNDNCNTDGLLCDLDLVFTKLDCL